MEKEILEKCIKDGNTLKKISIITGKCITTIRYWLKKFNLKTIHIKGKNKICECCGRKTEQGRMLCNICHVKVSRLRQKLALIEYKGGRGIKCGWVGDVSVLEFHHIDPLKKDFTLSAGVKSWKKMKEEVDKCVLLCSNCHRIEHSNNYWNNLVKYALKYKGENKELKNLLKMVV